MNITKKIAAITPEPTWWILRDLFSSDLPAGSVHGSGSYPSPGKRLVTDVESKIFTLNGRLRGGGQDTPVWGESKAVWTQPGGGGFARATGRTLVGLLLPEDTIVNGDIALGWASATDIGDPRTDGLAFLTEDGGEIDIIVPGVKEKLRGDLQWNMRPMQYLIGITLDDAGAVWWISTFGTVTSAVGHHTYAPIPKYPLAAILWVDRYDTTATYFPYIQYYGKITGPAEGYPNGNSLEDLRIVDVPDWSAGDGLAAFSDRFTRADSATDIGNGWVADPTGTWGINNNQAYYAAWISGNPHFVTRETGLADGNGIFTWDWTCPTAGTPYFFLYYRYQDTDNYYKIHNSAGNTININKVVAGVDTNFWSVAQVWTAGQTYHITAQVYGNHIILAIDNVIKLNSSGANLNEHLTATKFGFGEWYTPKTGERWDNIATYPLQTTLPSTISNGKIPTILTGGATLAQDTFTDANDTRLNTHTPEVGPAWTEVDSTWTIQGNAADPVVHATLDTYIVQDLGVKNAECQVEITLPGSGDDFFFGIVGRYVDKDHYLAARLCWLHTSPAAHEVELVSAGGTSDVPHKINLGLFYAVSTTYTLKIQFYGDLVQVFLNSEPIISYYIDAANNPQGTKFGLWADGADRPNDEGVVFDNWIVKEL